jgi:cysteine desulfurase
MFSFLRNKNKRRVYLDNAGATKVSDVSKRALVEAIAHYGNASAIHRDGVEALQYLDRARALCAKVLNAHAYEIYFTATGTESCNIAVLGTYEGWKKGEGSRKQEARVKDEQSGNENIIPHIIVSSIEHPAVLEPVRELERRGHVRVTYLPVYENGLVKVQDVREALTKETILVSVMYANNEIGTIQKVKEIGRAIEEWKKEQERSHKDYPYFHTDACQAANYCNLDAVRLRAHLMTLNSSKVYGPKGVALLYKREGIRIEPVVYGGGQERVLRSGTEDVAGAYAFAVALEESQKMKEREVERLLVLRTYCCTMLKKEIPDIVFYGSFDDDERLPNNINARVPEISSEEMILRLDAEGVSVSHKSACASAEGNGSYVIEALGGTEEEALENIRITLGRDTRKRDIDRMVVAMKKISEKYRTRN